MWKRERAGSYIRSPRLLLLLSVLLLRAAAAKLIGSTPLAAHVPMLLSMLACARKYHAGFVESVSSY